MNIDTLKDGFIKHLPALENFLKTIMLKKINAELSASSSADSSMVIEALKTGTVVAQSKDEVFDTPIYIAFDEHWIPQLASAQLNIEESEINEVTRDLMKEFTAQLLGTAQLSLKQMDIPIDPGEVELIKSGQITNSVDEREYFMAQVDINGKFEIEGDEQPEMAMIVTFGLPTDEKLKEVLGIPETTEEQEPGDEEDDLMSDEEIEKMMSDEGFEEDDDFTPGVQMDRDEDISSTDPTHAKKVNFKDFPPEESKDSKNEVRNLDRLKDVELNISVELGRKEVPLGNILHLVRGSVIELDKLAGEPVEVYANGKRIAEGEVVVIDEHFGVRITNLVSTRERIESLR